jgi:hypothetical protein
MSADIRPGDRVEYGMGTPQGRDQLGEVMRLEHRHREEQALIAPLSIGPGDGYAPSWCPVGMAAPWQSARWRYDTVSKTWVRTYAEFRRPRRYR